jgi:thiamine-phosphate pyrophosphorylase
MINTDEKLYRIIDANFNRSREGLRVCEEIARFVLDSKELTEGLKSVRHKISTVRKTMPEISYRLAASRDVEGDVGKSLNIRSRTRRASCADIYEANIQRVKESIRVLEEFFKIIDENTSRKFSSLRFKVYEIEQGSASKIAALKNR